jgi:hypothetical protein
MEFFAKDSTVCDQENPHNIIELIFTDQCPDTSVNGRVMKWFSCKGANFCIPSHHVCNHHPNCPMGEDEDLELCRSEFGYFILFLR